MEIWETIKKPFLKQKDPEKLSSSVQDSQTLDSLDSEETYSIPVAFFDNEVSGIFGSNKIADKLEKQKQKIMTYRNLAKNSDVQDGIEEIVNEIVNVIDDETPITIEFNEENEKIEKAITEKFDKINKLMNTKKNLYSIARQTYIDGQLNLHLAFKENATKEGIQKIKMIEPIYFYYDETKEKFKYNVKDKEFYQASGIDKGVEYDKEEIIQADFGLKENGLNLSYLENAIKTANQLQTLEDLLIPMRFSRSISRRVFNVDVGELPNGKAEETMKQYQNKFKYKKFYNAETGEVSNQQHITAMVEDYWFSNRSGGKGTTVDTLDESGNLGELDDILYFYKKLYRSMKIPSNRVPNHEDGGEFDYNDSRTTKEDIKFFMFISRLRQVYSYVYREILKREVISTEVMSLSEWEEYEDKISIKFTNSNQFIEKMELDNFMSALDNFTTALEQKDFFGIEKLLKDIFKFSDEQIKEMLKAVKAEKTSAEYKEFYVTEEGF